MLEIIRIFNNFFSSRLEKTINTIKHSKFSQSCQNNLCEAGEMLMYSIDLFEKRNASLALPLLRNVYDMTLKAIVMEKNEKVLKSYNNIGKKRTEDKDASSEIREIIAENFKEYFTAIDKDEELKNVMGDGFLTMVYNMLCSYSHATKMSEFVYVVQQDKDLNGGYVDYLELFILYPLIMIYFDAIYTKLDDELTVGEMYFLYITVLCKSLLELHKEYDFEKLKNLNSSFFGEKDDIIIKEIEKGKNYSLDRLSQINNLIMSDSKEEIEDFNYFYGKTLHKYFSEEEIKKILL